MLRLFLLLALCGCATVNPVTLARLGALDPLTADPSAFAARLSLPEGLVVVPGGAVLTLSANRADTGETVTGRFELVRNGDVWRLSDPDTARLRALQSQIRGWKSQAPDASSGALTISLTGCATGTGPDPDAAVSADLSLDGGASFAPLLRGLTAGEIIALADPEGTARPCPG